MPVRKKKSIQVFYLSNSIDWGNNTGKFQIHINRKLKGKKLLEIIIHECIHELWTEEPEGDVAYKAAVIARTLWKEGFREKDDTFGINNMQDELPK